MPRYMIERTFPDGLHIPINAEGEAIRRVASKNGQVSVLDPYFYR